MFKQLLTVSAMCAMMVGHAQIQNNGFESWTDPTTPDVWDTSNAETPSTSVSRGEPGHMSPFGALLQASYDGNAYPAVIHQTVPVDQAYENLEFYWSGNIPATDTLYAIATAVNANGDLLGISLGIYTAVSSNGYQQVVSPFMYFSDPSTVSFIDLALLYITYNDQPNDGVLIDDVNFTGVVTHIGGEQNAMSYFTQEGGQIRFSMKEQGAQVASVYSIGGQLVDRWNVNNAQEMNERNVANLASGVYVFQCGRARMKFVKQ